MHLSFACKTKAKLLGQSNISTRRCTWKRSRQTGSWRGDHFFHPKVKTSPRSSPAKILPRRRRNPAARLESLSGPAACITSTFQAAEAPRLCNFARGFAHARHTTSSPCVPRWKLRRPTMRHRDDPLPLSYRKLARLNAVPVHPPNVPNESRGDFQVESGSISGKYRLFSSSEKTILGKKTTVVPAGVPDKK